MELEEGDVVLCTVDRIVGTVVFVKINDAEKDVEGSIVTSEIAPGRIRNLRDYVVPKKKIVCKILRISKNGHIDLSLRRVSQKEAKEVMERAKQQQSYIKILKSMYGEKADEIIKKIEKNENIYEFFQKAKENLHELEKIFGKDDAKKIFGIIGSEKKKKTIIKKEIRLSSTDSDGLAKIKEIFDGIKKIRIKYLGGGKYVLESESDDIKSADNELRKIIDEIEKKARKNSIEFSIKEK